MLKKNSLCVLNLLLELIISEPNLEFESKKKKPKTMAFYDLLNVLII